MRADVRLSTSSGRSFDGGASITFKPLVQALELLGWQRDQDLLAHLYDFRWEAAAGGLLVGC